MLCNTCLLDVAPGARQVVVWSREGAHFSTSENTDGIEQALGWR